MTIHYAVEGTDQAYLAPGAARLSITYDDREVPLEVRFDDASGRSVRRIVFSRHREGHMLTELVQNPDLVSFQTSLLDANHDASIVQRAKLAALLQTAFPDEVFSSTTSAYDQNGRLLERTVRIGTVSEERTTFEYDDH
jgi:hypothetical protein